MESVVGCGGWAGCCGAVVGRRAERVGGSVVGSGGWGRDGTEWTYSGKGWEVGGRG